MSTASRSRQRQSEKSASTRKSPRKSREHAISAYFEQQHSDASEGRDSIAKPSARVVTKKTAARKRKIEEEEDYNDDSASEETPTSQKKIYDSDALDEDSDFGERNRKVKTVRTPKKQKRSSRKKKPSAESDIEFDEELKEGQEVVGVVVQAPKTGRVPPGQISQNTLTFLNKLKDPACNDREWFESFLTACQLLLIMLQSVGLNCMVKLCEVFLFSAPTYLAPRLEPVYRLAEKEWKDFVEAFTEALAEVDAQIPHLPPKDVIHRIYRDVSFCRWPLFYFNNLTHKPMF